MTIFAPNGDTIGVARPMGQRSEVYREHALRGDASARLMAAAPDLFKLVADLARILEKMPDEVPPRADLIEFMNSLVDPELPMNALLATIEGGEEHE